MHGYEKKREHHFLRDPFLRDIKIILKSNQDLLYFVSRRMHMRRGERDGSYASELQSQLLLDLIGTLA